MKPLIKWYLKNFRLNKKDCKEQIEKYENTLDCADPYKLKANALAIKKYSIWENPGNVDISCLIMGATKDTLHGAENIKRLLTIIPRSTYIELESNMETHSEKAGHIIAQYIQNIQNEF